MQNSRFGADKIWHTQDLEQIVWRTQDLENTRFGARKIWRTQDLEHVRFGERKILRSWRPKNPKKLQKGFESGCNIF